MTNAQVEQLIRNAAAKGRAVGWYYAGVYLQACEILSREPRNVLARAVIADFQKFLATGVDTRSFAEFFLPTPYTEEDLAAQQRSRDAHLAASAQA